MATAAGVSQSATAGTLAEWIATVGMATYRVAAIGLTLAGIAANTNQIAASGGSLTGSNASTFWSYAGTWNTSGSPTAWLMNVTNTASGATALLMDIQASSISQFNVSKTGVMTTGSGGLAYTALQGTAKSGTNQAAGAMTIIGNLSTGNAAAPGIIFQVGAVGSSGASVQTPTTRLTIGDGTITIPAATRLLMGTTFPADFPTTTAIGVDWAVWTVGLNMYNAGNSHKLRFVDMAMLVEGADFFLSVETAHNIIFRTTAIERWRITGAGIFQPGADNTFDIGTTALKVRDIWAGRDIKAASYTVAGTPGADFSGAVTNITVVKGIVTAAS